MRKLAGLIAFVCACALAAQAHAQTTGAQGSGLKPPPGTSKPGARPAAKPQQQPQKPTTVDNEANVKAVEKIFECIAAGLPKEWRQARVVITEIASANKERSFEGKFEYSTEASGAKPVPLAPCDPREVARGVYELNEFLAPEKRQWKVATLTFTSEGKFEIKYDYVR
jgi:hypothetical protein